MVAQTSKASVQYSPGVVPTDVAQLVRYLNEELPRLQGAIMALAAGHLDPQSKPPDRPRDGDWRFANGTSWNPGSGIGFYGYYNAAWHFLG